MFSPLEQFEVAPLTGFFHIMDFLGLSVTNYTLFAVVFTTIILIFFSLNMFYLYLIPTPTQYFLESVYMFIYNILATNLSYEEHIYFPYIFTIFTFILLSNLFGLLPYSYTLTSQLLLTSLLSFTSFLGLLIIGIERHGFNLLGLFFPKEAPLMLSFLLVPIEVISFFSRPFSLAIRLFANMTAGHVLLKILTGFAIVLFSISLGFVPSSINFIQFLSLGFDCSINAFNLANPVQNVTFVFFNTFYVNYDYDLYLFSTIYYYSNLFSIDELAYMVQKAPPYTYIWPEYIRWRRLFLFNYLAPIFFDFKHVRHSPMSVDSVIAMLQFFNYRGRGLISIFHNQAIFYLFNPYFFSLSSVICGKSAIFFLATSYDLFAVNLNSLFSFIDFLCSIIALLFSLVIPSCILMFFIILEIFVSILQAYVFTILLTIYFRDVIDLH